MDVRWTLFWRFVPTELTRCESHLFKRFDSALWVSFIYIVVVFLNFNKEVEVLDLRFQTVFLPSSNASIVFILLYLLKYPSTSMYLFYRSEFLKLEFLRYQFSSTIVVKCLWKILKSPHLSDVISNRRAELI